ncbi:MAG: DNA repair protein RadA [Flammeovirgaceae bacterium]|nr:DNA repair protein RadA [Flammeovirgaceae bacterium]
MPSKKTKTAYFCQQCGYESPKWIGKCPACEAWNSFVEELKTDPRNQRSAWFTTEKKIKTFNKPQTLSQIAYESEPRLITPDQELNRVLGGGIMKGSAVLIGGEPGIGKSTLMLQIALMLKDINVLYISGEESAQQIKARSERLVFQSEKCLILTETDTQNIFQHLEMLSPEIIIVDSIQTLASPLIDSVAGSISQVRECAAELIQYAKETSTPVFMIGHINKEGNLAGPKVLEHMVDTVLQFEGDRHTSYRILRTTKNRFGSTAELGIYEMQPDGLRQVTNPSEILLSQREENLSGIAIGATIEGNRPLLIETQSLVTPAVYGSPQRSSTGYDAKRLNMLLAVLEKRLGLKINFSDVFLNITGGLRIEDPAIDLAVCSSIISSHEDIPIPQHVCMSAEVGLGGEIRSVSRIEHRIAEAARLGFQQIFVSKYNLKSINLEETTIQIKPVGRLEEVMEQLFR